MTENARREREAADSFMEIDIGNVPVRFSLLSPSFFFVTPLTFLHTLT